MVSRSKKVVALLMTAMMAAGALAGCASGSGNTTTSQPSNSTTTSQPSNTTEQPSDSGETSKVAAVNL